MNARQEKIIHEMIANESWIKGKELASITGVTTRTIRSDIEKINTKFPELIESSRREGYKINKEVHQQADFLNETLSMQTPQERAIFIIKSLLLKNKKIKIKDLEEKFYVSEYTIESDINRIRTMIMPYQGVELIRSDNRLYFTGDEQIKRNLYKDLLEDEMKGNFLNLNKTAQLYEGFDLLKVTAIFNDVVERNQYIIRKETIPILIMHIGITMERMLSNNYLSAEHVNTQVMDRMEYQLAKEFFKEITAIIPIDFCEAEVVGLANVILGYQDSESLQHEMSYNGEIVNIPMLLTKITENIKQTFDVDFTKDKAFINGLHLHMQSLINRIQNKTFIPNLHLEEIKRSYPLIFEFGIFASKIINDELGFEISESEAGFIALHIGTAYERLLENKMDKYKVFLIAPQNESFSQITKSKLTNMFKERMEIVGSAPYLVEKELEQEKIDLIITTLPLQHSLDIKTIEISIFAGYKDENKIFRTLNELDRTKFIREFSDNFGNLIDDRFYFYQLVLETPEEVIAYMASQLKKENIVSSAFKDSVLEREKMASTSFKYAIATPHPLILESLHSKIAIAILKEPIQWGEYKVQLVMMPAIRERESSKMWLFFDWLSETIADVDKMEKLIGSKNRKEFVYWMLND